MSKKRRPGRSSEIRNRGPRSSWLVWASHSKGKNRRIACLLITTSIARGKPPLPICFIEGTMRHAIPIARRFIAGKVAMCDVVDLSTFNWGNMPTWLSEMILRLVNLETGKTTNHDGFAAGNYSYSPRHGFDGFRQILPGHVAEFRKLINEGFNSARPASNKAVRQ
jgi:hypothetical protein